MVFGCIWLQLVVLVVFCDILCWYLVEFVWLYLMAFRGILLHFVVLVVFGSILVRLVVFCGICLVVFGGILLYFVVLVGFCGI